MATTAFLSTHKTGWHLFSLPPLSQTAPSPPHPPHNCLPPSCATMVEAAAMSFSMVKAPHIPAHPTKQAKVNHTSQHPLTLRVVPGSSRLAAAGWPQEQGTRRIRASRSWKRNALPELISSVAHWPLMAVMVEHVAGQRDYVVHKSVWHLNDETIKNIYTMYIMFTCWGCCFFGSTKDPFYDGEQYRKDGGDGTVHWIYEKQEDIEENNRAELLREELIEEIELKVGGLRELEEAGREELVK